MSRGAGLALVVLLGFAPFIAAQEAPTLPDIDIFVPTPRGPDDAGGIEVIAPSTPIPAKARTNVFLGVVNLGPGDIRDVRVLVQPESDLVVIGQAERDLESIREDDSAMLLVRVATPDAAGSARLTLDFRFVDASGAERTATRTVTLQVAPPTSDPLEVTLEDATLLAGDEAALTLRLRNPSERALTNLDITVEADETLTPLGSDVPDAVPGTESSLVVQGARLAAGESRVVEVPLKTARVADELLSFTVTASYALDGFERQQIVELGARVLGTVELRVLEAREVDTGAGLELAGTLVNTGTGTAWNPRVDAAEGSGLRAESPALIEDLEANEAVDFRLRVQRVGEPAPGAPLLRVDWNDERGEVQERTVVAERVPLPPPAPSALASFWARATSALGLLALASVTLLALVLLGLFAARYVHHRHEERAETGEDAPHGRKLRWRKRGQKPPGGARPG